MYQVHGPSHLAENGVSVLPGRRTLGMPKAGFAGREQHHGTPLQNLASRCHLRPSPLVFQVILKFPNVPSIHSWPTCCYLHPLHSRQRDSGDLKSNRGQSTL